VPGGTADAGGRIGTRHNDPMTDDAGRRGEVHSAIEARRELGEELEPAVIDAFVTRVEQRIADRAAQSEQEVQRKRNHQKERWCWA
jgi:hypothetical protein